MADSGRRRVISDVLRSLWKPSGTDVGPHDRTSNESSLRRKAAGNKSNAVARRSDPTNILFSSSSSEEDNSRLSMNSFGEVYEPLLWYQFTFLGAFHFQTCSLAQIALESERKGRDPYTYFVLPDQIASVRNLMEH